MAYTELLYMPFSLKIGGNMLETILLFFIFITGIYFGSFYTLATYRIPKGENITHKHSYCPNCNHKLGAFDLIPIFSYLFLGGKCRYCKNKIGIRYFLFEAFTGLVFVLFTLSLNLNAYSLNINMIIYFLLAFLYFTSLFIIAGIEKEKNIINKGTLIYGSVISILYIIYSYTLNMGNVYEYVIYLSFMVILLLIDTNNLKKNLKNNYYIQLLILILYMLIFSGVYLTIYTIMLAVIAIGIKNILIFFKRNKSKVTQKSKKSPYAFFLCVCNIIVIIVSNFIMNYM